MEFEDETLGITAVLCERALSLTTKNAKEHKGGAGWGKGKGDYRAKSAKFAKKT